MPRRKKGRRRGKRKKYGGIKRTVPKRRKSRVTPQSIYKPDKSRPKTTKAQREIYATYMWLSLIIFLLLLITLLAGFNPVLGGRLTVKYIIIIIVFLSILYWRSRLKK